MYEDDASSTGLIRLASVLILKENFVKLVSLVGGGVVGGGGWYLPPLDEQPRLSFVLNLVTTSKCQRD